MVRVIEPYLGQLILEIGAGIGNISRQLPKRELLTVSDIDETYLRLLEDAFRGNELTQVIRLDLGSDEDSARVSERHDTIVCLNVLEHIRDDESAFRRMRTGHSWSPRDGLCCWCRSTRRYTAPMTGNWVISADIDMVVPIMRPPE